MISWQSICHASMKPGVQPPEPTLKSLGMMACCPSFVFVTLIKIPWPSQEKLGEKGVYFYSAYKVIKSFITGKSQWQEVRAAIPTTSIVKSRDKWICTCSLACLSWAKRLYSCEIQNPPDKGIVMPIVGRIFQQQLIKTTLHTWIWPQANQMQTIPLKLSPWIPQNCINLIASTVDCAKLISQGPG